MCVYNGNLEKNKVQEYLNSKNFPNRDKILKKIVDEKYTDTTKDLVIVFFYKNNNDNSGLGGIYHYLQMEIMKFLLKIVINKLKYVFPI